MLRRKVVIGSRSTSGGRLSIGFIRSNASHFVVRAADVAYGVAQCSPSPAGMTQGMIELCVAASVGQGGFDYAIPSQRAVNPHPT